MPTRYIPILRWKQGERIALSHLSSAGRTDVFPHFVVAQAQFGGPKKAKSGSKPAKKPPLSASEHLAKQWNDAWGKSAFYVDVSALSGTLAAHALDDLRAQANALGLQLIPSMRLDTSPEYNAAVLRAVSADGRGVALRVSLAQVASATAWISSWSPALSETDLIVDLGGGVRNTLAAGQASLLPFQSIHQASSWRSVTMAGGSIPPDLTGYFVGCTMLPRTEIQLWHSLRNLNLPYELGFGDYATVGPDATTDDIDYPVPINAKYMRA